MDRRRRKGTRTMTKDEIETNNGSIAAWINTHMDNGLSIQIATHLTCTRVKPTHRAAWRKAGFEFFKTDASGANLMISGQSKGKPRYSCIDYCKIEAY